MHPHLVTHQVVGRVPFDVDAYSAAAGRARTAFPAASTLGPSPRAR